ncbi:hypothetical protein A3K63_04455 [Candidatus Micrarchaeota archaeon RBG_16_49_10]|nr:MAG: hypothetical protein A3K63_04455 [Candidatus Micrarchaeota archaeon RBG_16_49_10]
MAKKDAGIVVPQLTRTIVPGVVLGREIVNYRIQPNDSSVYGGAPTLAELRYAYFGKNSDGSFVSPEYRESVLSNRGRGEWTSTFLRDGREAVERPENVVYRNGVWVAEGGKVARLELPPEGWALEYDMPTGFPSRTSQKRKDAEKVFGDDTSYFWYNSKGLRAVLRGFGLSDFGPFCVVADFVPGDRGSGSGVRSASR